MVYTDQHLLSLVIEHAPIGMAILFPNGKIKIVNTALINILGYSENELNDLSFESITHPEDVEESVELLTKAKNGEINRFQTEKRYIHKTGRIVWGILNLTVKRDADNHIEFIITQLVDITEQKAKELELKKIQELHQLIAEHSQDIIIGCCPNGMITYVSPAVCKHLGYEPNEVLGKLCYDFCHPEDLDNWMNQEDLDERKIIYRIRHIKGHYIWYECNSKKIRNDAGKVQHIITIGRDITERKQNEEFVLRSEKLSIVGELAAGIAHEVRNPLTSLRGFIQLLKSDDTSGMKNLHHEIMLSEIDRINEVVGEMLALAKPSRENYDRRSIDKMLHDVITLLEGQANLLDIEIREEIDSVLPHVVCNSSIKQVFINLLKNAMESMPNGGEIFIHAKKKGDKVCIQVIDQGCGLSPEEISKIGEPFYTTKETGTGLGLMVSQRIILNHKGTMQIRSEVGRGTAVEILLPY